MAEILTAVKIIGNNNGKITQCYPNCHNSHHQTRWKVIASTGTSGSFPGIWKMSRYS